MKITDRLLGDHKTFRKMLVDIEAIAILSVAERDRGRAYQLAQLFTDHLIVHAWFEDRLFYPAVAPLIQANKEPIVSAVFLRHLSEEHKTLEKYSHALEDEIKTGVPSWPQTFALLKSGLVGHLRREEEELFPAAEKELGSARLEDMSVEFEKERVNAPRFRRHLPLV